MSELERSVKSFRKALLERDAESRAAIQRSYQVALDAVRVELKSAAADVATMGSPNDPSFTSDGRFTEAGMRRYRLYRLQRVESLAEAEFHKYAADVRTVLGKEILTSARQGQDDAKAMIAAGFGTGPHGAVLPIIEINRAAMINLQGALQPGSPVDGILQDISTEARQTVKDALTTGLIMGEGALTIGNRIAFELGGQYARGQRLARTELMRAYREASHETYKANAHLMRGWIWFSAMNARTCAICISLHGKEFDTDVKMATHPNCRCVLMPNTKSWKDLGYDVPDTRTTVESGLDQFARWPEDKQRDVLGIAAHAAYANGDIELSDLVGITRSTVWGTGRRRVSLALAKERGKQAA